MLSGAVTKPVEKPKEDVNENNEEIKDDTSNNDVGTNTKPMNFTDVKENDWYYDAVSFAYEKGITSGTSESSFSPNDKVTRGQFITMLCRAYGISEMSGENFSDAGNTWYTGYLAAAKQLGISNGVGGNKFEPEKNITREEMVTLIYNYLKSIGEVEKTNSTTDFVDEGSISSWADESVAYAYSNGIVSGKGNNVFDPKGNATRAELAQIFFNMLK
ncbi:MAG: S-layer homology domain-containing protein [Clostridia bacterium]|nr:S-layer homology domain-containing protein [Clostridia bacterium]